MSGSAEEFEEFMRYIDPEPTPIAPKAVTVSMLRRAIDAMERYRREIRDFAEWEREIDDDL